MSLQKETARQILELTQLSSEDASNLDSMYGNKHNPLGKCISSEEDEINCVTIIDSLIDRAAKLVAANLAAVVLKTGKGESAEHPILMTIEGTAFYKLHRLKERFEKYFSGYLNGEFKRFVEFTEVPQSSLVGAALAALVE